jgi:ABC-2 type transport system permease protein
MKNKLLNIYRLGIKELRTLFKDKVMIFLIAYSFSFAIYIGATATSMEIHNASIVFIDEDRSALSNRVISGFYQPRFKTFKNIPLSQMDQGLDSGLYTFVVNIPTNFEKDVIAGKSPKIQVNIDATRMTQAGIGAGYIQQIINQEVNNFILGTQSTTQSPIEIVTRYKFNPNLTSTWFGSITEVINNIVMFSILLSGAALIREREHGTIEHLLVMPLGATEIMISKILSMSVVILVGVVFSLFFMVQGILDVPIAGSIPLFLFSTLLMLLSTTSLGIFMGTIAKNMPQLGMIFILTILPLMMLSGSFTPFESMPEILQSIMFLTPTSYFVEISQAILFRGAGIEVVWQSLVAIFAIGIVFFFFSLFMFRKSLEAQN